MYYLGRDIAGGTVKKQTSTIFLVCFLILAAIAELSGCSAGRSGEEDRLAAVEAAMSSAIVTEYHSALSESMADVGEATGNQLLTHAPFLAESVPAEQGLPGQVLSEQESSEQAPSKLGTSVQEPSEQRTMETLSAGGQAEYSITTAPMKHTNTESGFGAVVSENTETTPNMPMNTEHSEPTQAQEPDMRAGQEKYQTDVVPEGKPAPIEPQDIKPTETEYSCILSISCETLKVNINRLDPEKIELIPEDSLILTPTTVTFYEGESVFNVLQREMKKNRIHMEFVNTDRKSVV